jgi:hypothetical protein
VALRRRFSSLKAITHACLGRHRFGGTLRLLVERDLPIVRHSRDWIS